MGHLEKQRGLIGRRGIMTEVNDATVEAVDEIDSVETTARSNEEDIRLLTGFTDIFSAVVLGGLFIFISALSALAAKALGGFLVAAAAWFLTRYFVEKRRFAACGILLSAAFGIGITVSLATMIEFVAPLVAAGGLWMYWRRFRIPISAALAIAFATIGPVLIYFGATDASDFFEGGTTFNYIMIGIGLVLFAAAIYWDISDRDRVTRRSDVAFWLHVAAGPVLVHAIFSLLNVGSLFDLDDAINVGVADVAIWPVFLLVGFFALVAVIIDRRPLLITSFGYLVVAIGTFAYRQIVVGDANEQNIPQVLMIATMATGIFIVVLAGTWSLLRRFLLSLMPVPWAQKLAPVEDWRLPDEDNRDLPSGEKEPLRLVHGLNDYMAAIGMFTLFVGSLFGGYVVAAKLITPAGGFNPDNAQQVTDAASGFAPWVAILLPAAVICGLAAFFVRYRRMALTGVAAALQFALLGVFAVLLIFTQMNIGEMLDQSGMEGPPDFNIVPFYVGCVLLALANGLFWWFNRIPISFALGFSMLFPFMFAHAMSGSKFFEDGLGDDSYPIRAIIFGALAFGVAMWWDRQDPLRKTQRADNGFWMHLLAALFFIPAAYGLLGDMTGGTILMLAFFAVLVALALFIDRRAMLLVALPTVVESIVSGDNDGIGLAGAILLFGGLSLLNLFWDEVRGKVLPRQIEPASEPEVV
jgi:hypothetical protein